MLTSLSPQLVKECGRGDESHVELASAQEMVQFQLRHGNDLLAMDSLRACDVSAGAITRDLGRCWIRFRLYFVLFFLFDKYLLILPSFPPR